MRVIALLALVVACSNGQFAGNSAVAKKDEAKTGKNSPSGKDGGDGNDGGDNSTDQNGKSADGSKGAAGKGGTDGDIANDEATLGKTAVGTDQGKAGGEAAITDDGEKSITKVSAASAGLTFDGKASICLDWKAGKIVVTQLYEKYFAFAGTYETTSASGKKTQVQMQGAGSWQLPGDWGAKVCGATATMAGFQATTAGNRENQPIITTGNQGTQACFFVDDAEGDRGGMVKMTGVDFNVQKC